MPIDRLALVYDADGGLAGELRYIAGKLRGTASCALCDITHGVTGEKRAWRACRQTLGVPVDALHRDELDGTQAEAARSSLPCVLARRDGAWSVLIAPPALVSCGGRVERLEALLRAALERERW